MATPCTVDTCSITSSADPTTGRLRIDARLDAVGGLTCGTDANPDAGLRVNVDDCTIELSPSGLLGVIDAGIRTVSLSSGAAAVDIPESTGGGEATVVSMQLTNPSDCRRAMLILSRYEVKYSVGNTSAYEGDVVFRTLVDGANNITSGAAGANMPISGSGFAGNHDFWDSAWGITTINGGDTVTIEMDTRIESKSANLSVTGDPFGASGHIRAVVLPFDLATIVLP